MMKTKQSLRAVLAMTILVLAADAAAAEVADAQPGPGDTHEVRVVNNSITPVRVYAQDADGRLHRLGRVAQSGFELLEVPAEVTALGAFRIKVVSAPQVWGPATDGVTVRTGDLYLEEGMLSTSSWSRI